MTATSDVEYGRAAAERAAAVVSDRLERNTPEVGFILGSGLAGLADRFDNAQRVSYGDIPGFPRTTVVGHPGMLVGGVLAGRRAVALAGRFHMYEGHSAALAAFPVRVLAALGVRTLFVSNQDMLNRVVEHGVVGGKDCSTRISEDGCDTLVDETFPDDLRTRSLRGHELSVHCRRTSVKLIVVPTK